MTINKQSRFVSIVLVVAMLMGLMSYTVMADVDETFNPLTNVEISGNFEDLYVPGVTFTLSYNGANEIDEEASVIAWYVSGSENGEYEAIEGATGKAYKVLTVQGGKYLKAGITPVSADGSKTGNEVFSNIVYIEPALATPTQIYNTAMDDIGWSAYAANVINADEFEIGNKKSKFFVLNADEDGESFLVMEDYIDRTDLPSFAGVGLTKGTRTLNMDPSDPEHKLAYWLNTTYLNNTNYDALTNDSTDTVCSAYVGLPKAIVDNIDRDAVWRTERATTPNVSEEYVFKAAITLPSYTEIKTYGNKIKRVPNRQLLTRSVHNAEQMYAIGDYGAAGAKHLIGIPLTTEGVIRPIFKLKREFFTTTRIEPTKMGANIKALLVEYFKRAEVASLYTDEELTEMGFPVAGSEYDEDFKPLTNVKVNGNFGDLVAPGVTLTFAYDGASEIDESVSVISWHVSDDENGAFEEITDATTNTFALTATYGGKYIKAAIDPVSADKTIAGPRAYSQVVYVEPALATPVEIYNTAMTDIGWTTDGGAVLKDDEFEIGNNSKFFVLNAEEDGSSFLVMDDYMGKRGQSLFEGVGYTSGTRTVNMDPSDPNHKLAYWLNTTYINSPNYDTLTEDSTDTVCSSYIGLPKAIVDNIDRDAAWRTERATASGVIEEYVFKAAVTLPSYTEIKAYGNKIKRVPNLQLLTRTAYNAEKMYAIGDYNGPTGQKHLIGIPLTTKGVIRPIFRLKRSFFTTTRIEPSKMGANIKGLLVEYFTREELSSVYTNDELTAMGFGIADSVLDENYKPLSNIRLSGNFDNLYAPGVTFTINYDGGEAINGELSLLSWYVSDSGEEGTYSAIAGQVAKSFKANADVAGKYIRAGIVPLSADNKTTGAKVYSEAVYVEPALSKGKTIMNTAMTEVGWQDLPQTELSADEFDLGNDSRFIILDKAEDGSDFLVIDDYVKKGGISTTKSRTLNMDPSDPDNTLAYWLNNDFIESPNYDAVNTDENGVVTTSWKGLPESIVENLNHDAIWRTEASTNTGAEEYVFRAAVTLPSYGEIIKYGSKLRRVGGTIYHLRTPLSATQMFSIFDKKNEDGSIISHLYGVNNETTGHIKAIFRLKREFFTTTRIEPSKMGENVKKILVENFARSEFKGIYTDAELTAMGFGAEPTISNLEINGNINAGCTVKAIFDTDVELKTVEYEWSYSDSVKGQYTVLDVKGDTYKIADSLAGKYIKVGVRVVDVNGNKSGWVYYTATKPVGEKPELIVTAETLTYADGKLNASFEIENSLNASKDMIIILAVYDKTTKEFVGCDITEITVGKGLNSYSANEYAITVSSNQYVKAMVWDSILNMNPYCLNVLK